METKKIYTKVILTAHFSLEFSSLQFLTIFQSLSELKDMTGTVQSTYLLHVLSQRYSETIPKENQKKKMKQIQDE